MFRLSVMFEHFPTPSFPFFLPGVLSDPQAVADVVKRISPDTLVILDAVCAVASEDIRMDNWGIDVVISASQKGLGAPPGLSIVIASQKAMKVHIFISVVGVPAQRLMDSFRLGL